MLNESITYLQAELPLLTDYVAKMEDDGLVVTDHVGVFILQAFSDWHL